ncbi:MAG: hypothetical protein GX455_10110 [Phycisphaerae bacterium]|nr:hypothetical protein [Phycisphaerae bacterium]
MASRLSLSIAFMCLPLGGILSTADCPSADRTGDCFVDLEDLTILANNWTENLEDLVLMASQWLTGNPHSEEITVQTRENAPVLIEIPSVDLQGNPIQFSPTVFGLPKRASFDPQINILSWQPWYDQSGLYELLFYGVASEYSQKIQIEVEDVPLKTWYEEWMNSPQTQSGMVEY